MDFEIWFPVSVTLGVVVTALIIFLLMERERKKPLSGESVEPVRSGAWGRRTLSTRRTVTGDIVKEARDRLRILDLEREILSYAIRRLYEASAEGKITEEERERLAVKYKEDLKRIKEEISRGESIVALNELERMQEEFVKLFSERFEELNKRIEGLRELSGFAPPELEELEEREEPEELEEAPEEEKKEEKAEAPREPAEKAAPPRTKRKTSKPKAPPEPEKTEAEKKVEQIVAEVEKVLKRLGEMEVEE